MPPEDRLVPIEDAAQRAGRAQRSLERWVATGLLTGCGGAVTDCRLSHLGTALDILSPGASARDPGMVSPSANGHSGAIIQEVDMEDCDVDGLPTAEHRRLAASRSG